MTPAPTFFSLPFMANPRSTSQPTSGGNTGSNTDTTKNGSSDQKKTGKPLKGQQRPISTLDLQKHLVSLKATSAIASKLFSLIGDQLTSVSYAIPIQRGLEMVGELKSQAKTHRDGLKTAFDPLKEQLTQIKAGFWAKHGERLQAGALRYIEQKLKERIPDEIKKQLGPYIQYIKNRETDTKRLVEVGKTSHARLQNSLLRIKYPHEPITWIGDLPEEVGPTITLDELKNADDASVMILAESLGLSPSEESDKIDVLNRMMRYLGIAYKGLPSRAGVLLMPL